jgi:hypothetical protein
MNRWLSLTIVVLVLTSYLIPRANYTESDIQIYKTSLSVASQGGNPYDPAQMERAFTTVVGAAKAKSIPMAWNPPIFLIFPGLLFALPAAIIYSAWPAFLVVVCSCMALLGVKLAASQNKQAALLAVLLAFISIPSMIEIYVSQISSAVSLLVLLGMTMFIRGGGFGAGALMAVAVVKPHIVLLPCCLIACWVLRGARWMVILGAFSAILVGAVLAEVLFPSIWLNWVYRPSWPISYLGASVPSLIRGFAIEMGYSDPLFVLYLIPLLGVFTSLVWLIKRNPEPSAEGIIWALMINPFITPYGFIFDHANLIVVQSYVLAKLVPYGLERKVVLSIMVAGLMTVLAYNIPGPGEQLWWMAYATFLVLGLLLSLRSVQRKIPTIAC